MSQTGRMNRGQFFEKVQPRTAEQLQLILWNLYWRGAAPLRDRIEEALSPPAERKPRGPEPVDAEWVLEEARDFVRLARAGAYMGGTREVSRSERSRWRVTFRNLVDDASRAVEQGDREHGVPALELLVDLACESHDRDYFHSQDPVEAMKVVVSERVHLLWRATLESEGFAAFARRAAKQLCKWERSYGWTRFGSGSVAERETSLASVLSQMLSGVDSWIGFADQWLRALDSLGRADGYDAERRTERLSEWHAMLLERLHGTEAEDRLDRLVRHPSLAGPERTFLEARLERLRGNLEPARRLVRACLERLPGHQGFLEFAREIDAPLPAAAARFAGRKDTGRTASSTAD